MKKMKSLLLVLGMIIIAGSNVRAEKKILKNELPKTEKEFLENGNDRMIDLDDGNEVQPQDDEGQPKFLIKRIVLKRPKDGIKLPSIPSSFVLFTEFPFLLFAPPYPIFTIKSITKSSKNCQEFSRTFINNS